VVSLSILGKYGVCYRLDLQLMMIVDFDWYAYDLKCSTSSEDGTRRICEV